MRKLTLNREPLAELAPADLASVAAGAITHGCTLYPTYHDLGSCLRPLLEGSGLPSVDHVCGR